MKLPIQYGAEPKKIPMAIIEMRNRNGTEETQNAAITGVRKRMKIQAMYTSDDTSDFRVINQYFYSICTHKLSSINIFIQFA
jgi:hypothetical protein